MTRPEKAVTTAAADTAIKVADEAITQAPPKEDRSGADDYRFERFNGTDFKYDDLGLTPPTSTTDVTMSDNVNDYNAHIFITRVIYEF